MKLNYNGLQKILFPTGSSSIKITKPMIENMMEYQTCGQCTSSYRVLDSSNAILTSGPGWTFANEEITLDTTTEIVIDLLIQRFFLNSDCDTKVIPTNIPTDNEIMV